MFTSTIEHIQNYGALRYKLTQDGNTVCYGKALDLLQNNIEFRSFLTKLLVNSEYDAFRWETPPVTKRTLNSPFEFVLLNASGFCSRSTDHQTFSGYFTTDETDQGVVVFKNTGKDATLVVPSPRAHLSFYGHLAAFVRNAPEQQIDAFWKIVGITVTNLISDTPIWLSTAGGGVAWLHVRVDTFPKYYGFIPFKQFGN